MLFCVVFSRHRGWGFIAAGDRAMSKTFGPSTLETTLTIKVQGTASVKVSAGELEFHHKVVIGHQITAEAILGMDFLQMCSRFV